MPEVAIKGGKSDGRLCVFLPRECHGKVYGIKAAQTIFPRQ
jgi:hypothetical protein